MLLKKHFGAVSGVLAAALLLAAPVCANPAAHGGHMASSHGKPMQHLHDRFDRMDSNHDGSLSVEEFRAAYPNMNDQAFGMIDTNRSGAIERAEWFEFMEGHAKGNMPGMGQQRAPMLNNIPGDPLIPPPDSSDLPLMRPPQ